MSFNVEPADLRAYAAKLAELHSDVEVARGFVKTHGSFSFHQTGLIGVLSGAHAGWMQQLDAMCEQLMQLTDGSARALEASASTYETTDDQAAARVDNSYPAAPRPQIFKG